MSLEELLEELVKADPEVFTFANGNYHVLHGHGRTYKHWIYISLEEKDFFEDCKDVEYALREAIEASGWRWESYGDGAEYQGTVQKHIGGILFQAKSHNVPVIALGMAYLKALGGAV